MMILMSVHGEKAETKRNHTCPLWSYPEPAGKCVCANDLNKAITCNIDRLLYLKRCYCMTVDTNVEPVVSSCLYTCNQQHPLKLIEMDISDLNNETCGPFNRNGTMCGECIEGHGLPVYSYDISCVECMDYKYNWLKYMAVAYGPLTVFYFIIIIFRISANSGLMIDYVTISQMVSNTYLNYIYLKNPHSVVITRLFVLFNSIWNLNFFRSLYPPFCLHPHLSALQAISLDYIAAI